MGFDVERERCRGAQVHAIFPPTNKCATALGEARKVARALAIHRSTRTEECILDRRGAQSQNTLAARRAVMRDIGRLESSRSRCPEGRSQAPPLCDDHALMLPASEARTPIGPAVNPACVIRDFIALTSKIPAAMGRPQEVD